MDSIAPGAVFVQTNDADSNRVIAFRRGDDGSLDRMGSYETGGCGSGAPHLPAAAQRRRGGRRAGLVHPRRPHPGRDRGVRRSGRRSRGLLVSPERRAGPDARQRVGAEHAQRGLLGAVTKDGRHAYLTNFGDNTISSSPPDGRFLYALDADSRALHGWSVSTDGELASAGVAGDLPLTAAGLAAV
jgi:hypothetical protein